MKGKYKNVLNLLGNASALIIIFVYRTGKKLQKLLRPLPSLRSVPALRSLPSAQSLPRSRTNLIVFFGIIILLMGGLSLYFFFPEIGKSTDGKKTEEKIDVLKAINKGKLVGTSKLGETINMGNLEITLWNTKEGSYKSFELDPSNNRISKTYFGANMKIFNTGSGPGLDNNEILYMIYEDDFGKQYERDSIIEFLLGNIKDYGPDKNVWPRTIREGYLLFPGPAKESKNLKLIIYSEVSKEKIVFELVR